MLWRKLPGIISVKVKLLFYMEWIKNDSKLIIDPLGSGKEIIMLQVNGKKMNKETA